MKKCSQCKQKKELSEFHRNQYICKICRSENAQEFYIENRQKILKRNKKYELNNPWIRTFKSINQRCTNPNLIRYKHYGLRGIKCLITSEELKYLWYRDKAYKMNQPTIDREDNDGHYELSNCRYIDKKQHNQKSASERIRDKKGRFTSCR